MPEQTDRQTDSQKSFLRALGVNSSTITSTSGPRAPTRKTLRVEGTTRQERQKSAKKEAKSESDRQWKRYQDIRAHRLERLLQKSSAARRFVHALAKLRSCCTRDDYLGYRDCAYDLAGLARKLDCGGIADSYNRLLLYEEASAFVRELAKVSGVKRADYYDDDDERWFVPNDEKEPTALDELKRELRLL